jgi:hypothetical protein
VNKNKLEQQIHELAAKNSTLTLNKEELEKLTAILKVELESRKTDLGELKK